MHGYLWKQERKWEQSKNIADYEDGPGLHISTTPETVGAHAGKMLTGTGPVDFHGS